MSEDPVIGKIPERVYIENDRMMGVFRDPVTNTTTAGVMSDEWGKAYAEYLRKHADEIEGFVKRQQLQAKGLRGMVERARHHISRLGSVGVTEINGLFLDEVDRMMGECESLRRTLIEAERYTSGQAYRIIREALDE